VVIINAGGTVLCQGGHARAGLIRPLLLSREAANTAYRPDLELPGGFTGASVVRSKRVRIVTDYGEREVGLCAAASSGEFNELGGPVLDVLVLSRQAPDGVSLAARRW
jgi:hypothetical protein